MISLKSRPPLDYARYLADAQCYVYDSEETCNLRHLRATLRGLEGIKTSPAWIENGKIVEGGLNGWILYFTHEHNKRIIYDKE